MKGLGKVRPERGQAFEEFRRMEDKIEHVENTVLAQGEVNAALDGRGPGGMSPAEVEATCALESGAAASPAPRLAKSEVEDELQALKKKVRIGS